MDKMFMQGQGPMAIARGYARTGGCERGGARLSKPLDQAGVDQQPVEAPRLRAAGTGEEQPLAALEDACLLREGGIERQAGRLLHHERKIGPLERVERGGEVDGPEVDGVDGVVGGEIAWIVGHQAPVDAVLVELRLKDEGGELGLMVAVTHHQERLAGKIALEPVEQGVRSE